MGRKREREKGATEREGVQFRASVVVVGLIKTRDDRNHWLQTTITD